MPFQITIKPSDHAFSAESNETILTAALRAGITLPYGCRNGACGSCKGHVLEGKLDYGHHQPETLTPEEKAEGKALFCCATPLTKLVIEAREVRLAGEIQVRKLPCRVHK